MKRFRLKKKYAIILLVLGGLALFTLVLGGSYAFFTQQVTSKDYIVYTGNLQIDYTRTGNLINLTKAYPKTNTDGLKETGYTFNITNNGNIDARYQIRLELDSTSNMPLEYVKMAYIRTKSNSTQTDEEIEPILLSNLNNTLTFISDKQIEAGKEDSYNLKLWIDYNAPNDIQGKTFKATIVVDSLQDVEDGYVMGDTAPIITLNKFSNGQIDQLINVGSTFIDPGILSVKDDKDLLTQEDVTVTGSVNTNQVGVYDITYSVTDSSNNTTTVTRTIGVGTEASLNIKHSVSGVLAMYTPTQQENNEAIFCSVIHGNDDMYLGCKLYDKVEDAFSNHARGIIIMTNNAVIEQPLELASSTEYIFDLNGKSLDSSHVSDTSTTYIDSARIFVVEGALTINDSASQGSLTTGANGINIAITGNNSKVLINGGTYTGRAPLFQNGSNSYLEINGGTFVATTSKLLEYGSDCTSCNTVINDGTFTQNSNVTLVYLVASPTLKINDGDFSAKTNVVYSNTDNAVMTINGGNFTSNTSSTISNEKASDITINGGTFASNNANAIRNTSTGIVTINGGYFRSNAGYAINQINGTLTINGDEVTLDNNDNYVSGTYIYGNGSDAAAIFQSGGVLVVNGGTIYHANVNNGTWRQHAYRLTSGTAYLNGGNFKSDGVAFSGENSVRTIYTDHATNKSTSLNISGAIIHDMIYANWDSSRTNTSNILNICSGNVGSIKIGKGAYAYIKSTGITWGTAPTFGTYIIQDDSITCSVPSS